MPSKQPSPPAIGRAAAALLRCAVIDDHVAAALCGDRRFVDALAANPSIGELTKDRLCPLPLSAAGGAALAGGPLSAAQLTALCSRARPATAAKAIMVHHQLNETQAGQLLGPSPAPSVLDAALRAGYQAAAPFAAEAAAVIAAGWAAHQPESVAGDDVAATWVLSAGASSEAPHVLAHRPQVADAMSRRRELSSCGQRTFMALEMSAALADIGAQDRVVAHLVAGDGRWPAGGSALALNPAVSADNLEILAGLRCGQVAAAKRRKLGWPAGIGPLDGLDDPALIDSLVDFAAASCSGGYLGGPLWYWTMLPLAANTHLSDPARRQLKVIYKAALTTGSAALAVHARDAAAALDGTDRARPHGSHRRPGPSRQPARPAAAPETGAGPALGLAPLPGGAEMELAPVMAWIGAHLGTKVGTWELALETIDSFEGTAADFVTLVDQLAH